VALARAGPGFAEPAPPEPELSTQIVGSQEEYSVVAGDFVIAIGARFGVDAATLARDNGLDARATIHPGQVLRVDRRHIVPRWEGEAPGERIVINVPQRLLFHFREDALVSHYPVALGRPDWRTPLGEFTIARREVDKTWYVPPSIQEEMRMEGKPVLTEVPPGPDNPLGRHWLGLSASSCGIHGTIAPSSIYQFRTHGCIRLHPDDAAALFAEVQVGEPVQVVYLPVLLATPPEGGVFLEVHPDVYHREEAPLATLARLALRHALNEEIDWERARLVVDEAAGVARPIHAGPDRAGDASGAPR
jgi:L,D-transpeptidase ErfK/SrfK